MNNMTPITAPNSKSTPFNMNNEDLAQEVVRHITSQGRTNLAELQGILDRASEIVKLNQPFVQAIQAKATTPEKKTSGAINLDLTANTYNDNGMFSKAGKNLVQTNFMNITSNLQKEPDYFNSLIKACVANDILNQNDQETIASKVTSQEKIEEFIHRFQRKGSNKASAVVKELKAKDIIANNI